MRTTPHPATPATAGSVAPYDWSDPDAYRPPAFGGPGARSDAAGHGSRGAHAFWERLPFQGAPWTRVLIAGVVCFALWFLLDATSLQHSAQVSPLGSRRTVSLDVVGPVAALSRALGLSSVVGSVDRSMGRTPGGGPALSASTRPPLPKPKATTATGTPTPTTLPALDSHPTPASPLKVLIVGDSLGLDLGQPLVDTLDSYGDVEAYLDARIDTGLTRPDYFDWPAELQIDLANRRPDLVVVMIGANDPQGLVTADGSVRFGQPGWDAAYSSRVTAFIAEANAAGAHVLWVGMPPMQDPGLDAALRHLDGLVSDQVARTRGGGAAYVSAVPSLGDKKGAFSAFLPDASGAEVNVRTPDGIHLTTGGGTRLAAAVANAVQTRLHVQLAPGAGGSVRRS